MLIHRQIGREGSRRLHDGSFVSVDIPILFGRFGRWGARQCAGDMAHFHYGICCNLFAVPLLLSAAPDEVAGVACLDLQVVVNGCVSLVMFPPGVHRKAEDIGFLHIVRSRIFDPVVSLVTYRRLAGEDWSWNKPGNS